MPCRPSKQQRSLKSLGIALPYEEPNEDATGVEPNLRGPFKLRLDCCRITRLRLPGLGRIAGPCRRHNGNRPAKAPSCTTPTPVRPSGDQPQGRRQSKSMSQRQPLHRTHCDDLGIPPSNGPHRPAVISPSAAGWSGNGAETCDQNRTTAWLPSVERVQHASADHMCSHHPHSLTSRQSPSRMVRPA